MEHVLAQEAVTAPAGMYLGSAEVINNTPYITLANFYGGKGDLSPGWYLLGRLWASHRIPLAGPFNSRNEAYYAYEMSRRVTVEGADSFAFVAQSALLFQPIVFVKPSVMQIASRARIDSFVKLEGGEGLVVGENVHIASFAHVGIGGGLTILEEGSAVASHACIISGSNQPEAISCSPLTPPDQHSIVRKTTTIKKNACVFVGAIVSPGVTIGEGARILPGAVVTCDVGPFETWGGVPAKFIRRDMSKFRLAEGR